MAGSSKEGAFKRVAHREWHALSVDEVVEAFQSSAAGLANDDAQARKEVYGKNEFSKGEKRSVLIQILDQLKSPLTLILIVAAITTFALNEVVDTVVIAFALLIAVIVGVIQEGRASRAFEKLAASQVHSAITIRDGKRHEIPAAELAPGDVVLIQDGAQVPADVRLFESKKLSVNEATLTGEWMAVDKYTESVDVGAPLAERSSVAYKGTFVAGGYGVGFVVATGDDTEVGKLAKELSDITEESTPIQWEMQKISRIMVVLILALVAAIFLIGVFRGAGIESMLVTSIAIAVAAIPEGLPAAVTIILAVGMESLLSRGGLVRNLLAAETLGSTDYILTDKTGTLTKARMAVTDVTYRGCEREQNKEHVCNWHGAGHAKFMFDLALCASDAFLDETDDHETYVVRGEPIERAILEGAQELGMTTEGESMRAGRVDYLAFSSENRFAAGLAPFEDTHRLCINGAPEYLLDAATKVSTPDGEAHITSSDRKYFTDQITRHTQSGKRLIAIGYKDVSYDRIPEDVEEVLTGIVFVGLLSVHDPVRDGISAAITGVKRAGAHVRLVTGDNPQTALAIAKDAGIAKDGDIALTGKDITQLNDSELIGALKTTKVFARVLPRQKMRLARVLQSRGHVVAMTGDGINDAPALQKANIGVAIGSGTEVAKEASDLVLVNDSFETIYSAIEEGRRIIANLRKIVGYLLSTSLSEAVLIGAALLIGAPLPILPAQILWANIIEEGLMSVAFAFEPGEKNAMKTKPQDIRNEGVLSKDMLSFMALVVTSVSVLLLAFYLYLRTTNLTIEEIRSIMFLAISIDSLFIAFSFRSLTVPVWHIPLHTNRFFLGSFVVSLALLLIAISTPFLQFVLSYEPVGILGITAALIYGLVVMLMIEGGKWFFFRHR